MDVIVDGSRDFRLQGEPEDALAAVAAISEYLQKQGRAILVIKADGSSIAPDTLLDTLQGKPLADISSLEVESADVAGLVEGSLKELNDTLPELPKACHELAAIFQGSTPEEGFEPFHKLADIWANVKSRELMVANALNLNFDELCVNGESVTALHEELNLYLTEAAVALESGDLVLLGDLLEYELAPRAEVEPQIVALLRERSQSQAN
ncbi:MAG: hypothetical protein AMXMBFR82_01450 [Candidatus Hydrogenedentota bacterium]